MRLTQWTDYALRVLMYCAVNEARAVAPTIAEIAREHNISRSHLMKVVMALAAQGWVATTRGRGGGLRLLKPAQDIPVGTVVRQMEGDFTMVECFNPDHNDCRLISQCALKSTLGRALQAYMDVLDGVSLADVVAGTQTLASVTWQPLERRRL